jgi:hypothetical protein
MESFTGSRGCLLWKTFKFFIGRMVSNLSIAVNHHRNFTRKKANISRSDLSGAELQDIILELFSCEYNDQCSEICKRYMESKTSVKESEILSIFLTALYKVGIIGIKLSSLDTFVWSFIDQPSITIGDAKRTQSIKIHKMLHRALDIILNQNEIYAKEDYT